MAASTILKCGRNTCGISRACQARSTFQWLRRQDIPFERLFLHIDEISDYLVLTLCADTHYVSPQDMQACLSGMEALTIEAALDPAAHIQIRGDDQ